MAANAASLEGRTCLVTGATSGIGEAAALELARLGATVILTGRDPSKCRAAVDRIRRETGNPLAEHIPADLSSQAEVRALAAGFLERHELLHVLVNNAGAVFLRRRLSADGIEMTLALNHLGPFLLTERLLGALKRGAPSRIINVSSNAHKNWPLDFDDLQLEHGYRPLKAYYRSKFANVLFTYELARRLEGAGVTANVLHPGLVFTNIARSGGRPVYWAWRLYARRHGAVAPREGAAGIVHLASSPEVAQLTGAYFIKTARAKSGPATYDTGLAARLWQVSARLTGAT